MGRKASMFRSECIWILYFRQCICMMNLSWNVPKPKKKTVKLSKMSRNNRRSNRLLLEIWIQRTQSEFSIFTLNSRTESIIGVQQERLTYIKIKKLGLWCLVPLSIIFQLSRGGHFYWWSTQRKPPYCRKSNFII